MTNKKLNTSPTKGQLHPRNLHQGHYDFDALARHCPDLKRFFKQSPRGKTTIDFSNNEAVLLLNQALLAQFYQVTHWGIPEGFLCPPIPGRVDYIHYLADLLAETRARATDQPLEIPTGASVKGLDIGTGANCIYPILGSQSYGWKLVGAEVDPVSLASAKTIVQANSSLKKRISLVAQNDHKHIFIGVIRDQDIFDFTLCNPPFHASAADAASGSKRKWKNLDRKAKDDGSVKLNFGGQSNELWYDGGEVAFIKKMINESKLFSQQVCWFTTLVSKAGNLNQIKLQLKKLGVADTKVIKMSQGIKNSRFIAWTFLDPEQQANWAKQRWQK